MGHSSRRRKNRPNCTVSKHRVGSDGDVARTAKDDLGTVDIAGRAEADRRPGEIGPLRNRPVETYRLTTEDRRHSRGRTDTPRTRSHIMGAKQRFIFIELETGHPKLLTRVPGQDISLIDQGQQRLRQGTEGARDRRIGIQEPKAGLVIEAGRPYIVSRRSQDRPDGARRQSRMGLQHLSHDT